MKSFAVILIACIISIGFIGCGGGGSKTPSATAAELSSIQITPASTTLAVGKTQQLKATGTHTDNSTVDLTSAVTWFSASQSVASVNASGLVTAVSAGPAAITATFGSISSAPASINVTAAVPPTLSSIQITPASATLVIGKTQQLKATGTYSDNSTQDLTSAVTWFSASQTVASVNASGLVTAVSAGPAAITATFGSISSAPASINVTAAVPPTLSSIQITPPSATLVIGKTQQLKATGTYSDNSTQDLTSAVTWVSASQSVASVNASGLLTALAAGPTAITASYGGISSAPATINVTATALSSIVVAPSNASIATGETQQFTATGNFSDGSAIDITNSVIWDSDSHSVATMSVNGLASGLSAGTANISATSGGVVGYAPLTVTAAVLQSISLSPDGQSIPVGGQLQFGVTGTFSDGTTQAIANATYSSSAPTIAVVDPVTGVATGVASSVTPVTITATVGSFTDTSTLTVLPPTLTSIGITPVTATLTTGTTAQFALTGFFSDGSYAPLTEGVSWSSFAPTIAGVGANGLASALTVGQATISATYQGLSASAALTVVLGPPTSITVTPALPSIGIDSTQQFTATAVFGDGSSQDLTSQVQWISSAASIALISNTGLASGVSTGTAQITAVYQGVQGSATLTVSTAKLTSITVLPATPVVPTRTKIQFTAWGNFSDGSTSVLSGVSWHTNSPSHAQINGSGVSRTKKAGNVTVSATLNGITGSTLMTVTSSKLASVTITPNNAAIAPGTTQQFALIGAFGDGTQVDISNSAYWATSNYQDAVISKSGLASAIATGQVTITATFQTLSNTVTLTVSSASIVSVSVAPPAPSIALGSAQQFTATGTFNDNTSQDITVVSQWTSSNLPVAVVNGTGLATSAGRGMSNINASFKTASGTAVLTVN
jgi:uncharacterized protein YjdB